MGSRKHQRALRATAIVLSAVTAVTAPACLDGSEPDVVEVSAIVLDLSESDSTVTCSATLAYLDERLTDASPSTEILILGSAWSRDHEPSVIHAWSTPSFLRVRGIQDPGDRERNRNRWFQDLMKECREHEDKKHPQSPIALGLERAVEAARSRCRIHESKGAQCRSELLVVSDLRDPEITRRRSKKPAPVRFENQGVSRVLLCGFGESSMPAPSDLVERWRALFKNPASVYFEPYCSRWSGTSEHTDGRSAKEFIFKIPTSKTRGAKR